MSTGRQDAPLCRAIIATQRLSRIDDERYAAVVEYVRDLADGLAGADLMVGRLNSEQCNLAPCNGRSHPFGLDDGSAVDGKFLDLAFRTGPGCVNYATVFDSGHKESSSDSLPALG